MSRVFQLVSVSAASPAWSAAVPLGAVAGVDGMGHLMLYNKNATALVEFSHDGTNVHGELDPGDGTRGQTFDDQVEASIYFRIKSGSTGPAVVYVKGWLGR